MRKDGLLSDRAAASMRTALALRGTNLGEVETSSEDLAKIAAALAARRPAGAPFIIGVTGSVASGKSTLASALAPVLEAWPGAPKVARFSTDGFLLPNHILAERGLEARKGFPESYDLVALASALSGLRRGPMLIPTYCHITYDVDPARARMVSPPDILIVEGLHLGLDRSAAGPRSTLIDTLIYLDAAEEDLESWYVERFLDLWEEAEHDPDSFYRRFRQLDRAGVTDVARAVWAAVNLPNLREYIAPVRALADLVVVKRADHRIEAILETSDQAPN